MRYDQIYNTWESSYFQLITNGRQKDSGQTDKHTAFRSVGLCYNETCYTLMGSFNNNNETAGKLASGNKLNP